MNVKNTAIKGVQWTFLSAFLTTIIEFIRIFFLARLVHPDVFGLFAIVFIIISIFSVIQRGLRAGIIQKHEYTQNELTSLYYFILFTSLIIFFLILFLSRFVIYIYDDSILIQLIRLASLSFLILPIGLHFRAIIAKSLYFNLLSIVEVIKSIASAVVTILLAYFGYGVWSFVWGLLFGSLIESILFIIIGFKIKLWIPNLHFNLNEIKPYLSFGIFKAGEYAFDAFIARIDQLVIGSILGPSSLGIYSVGYNLTRKPNQKIVPIVNRVSFPIFSAVQDDIPRLKNGLFKALRMLAYLIAPIMFGIASVAHLAVPLLLGDKWLDAIPIIQILSIYVLIMALEVPIKQIANSKGKSDWLFYLNLFYAIFLPAIIWFTGTIYESIVAVAISLLVFRVITFMFMYVLFIKPLLGNVFDLFIKSIIYPLLFAVCMATGIYLADSFLLVSFSIYSRFFTMIFLGFFIYIGFLIQFQSSVVKEFTEVLPCQVAQFINKIYRGLKLSKI